MFQGSFKLQKRNMLEGGRVLNYNARLHAKQMVSAMMSDDVINFR